MKITLLTDNQNSWIMPYVETLKSALLSRHYEVHHVLSALEITDGDIACFLSCEKIVPKDILAKNTYNLVVHESTLPKGKGWSPLTWQILEGKNDISITLFEAVEAVDAGPIYFQEGIHFEGHELLDEMKDVQGKKTIELILKFIDAYPNVEGWPQKGEESFYPRRRPADSEIDIKKSLEELFNQLRVVDNERYPAFFRYKNHTYILKIFKKL